MFRTQYISNNEWNVWVTKLTEQGIFYQRWVEVITIPPWSLYTILLPSVFPMQLNFVFMFWIIIVFMESNQLAMPLIFQGQQYMTGKKLLRIQKRKSHLFVPKSTRPINIRQMKLDLKLLKFIKMKKASKIFGLPQNTSEE